jgi:nitrate/TMAO reductase-like tetraheme cytochrome c subunit
MPPRDTGKQRAARIPLDYYKRANAMERWKNTLAVLALLASVGVAGAAWLFRDGGKAYVSRGPVAGVHAAWDEHCESCHADFHPISKNSFSAAFFGPSGSPEAANNQRCEQCHSGTAHHETQLEAMTPGCGGCHRDHRGREASLTWLPDADCTQCHTNLSASMKNGKTEYANTITGFGDASLGHPEFKSLKSDPGKLKFNHALHMRPGQVIVEGQDNPWTLGKIADKTVRERYANAPWQSDKSDGGMVVLDCASCHRLDAGDFGVDPATKPAGLASSVLTPRAAGAYVLPVNYEIHCAACHPLTFDPAVKGKDGQPLGVPHHLQPEQVKDFVWGAYAEALGGKTLDQRVADALKAGPKPSRPLPGKLTEAEQAARDAVGKDAVLAEDFLFKADVKRADGYLTSGKSACGECHVYDTVDGVKKIGPLMVNEVWLAHAKFSHVSHRAYDCRGCHPDAYATLADGKPNATASVDHKDVLIKGVGTCRLCHSTAAGVRSDCTECHFYHNGDRSLQGLGAAARDPHEPGQATPRRFTGFQQFLSGNRD